MKPVLTLLIYLFPAPFREQFGAELARQVEEGHARARAKGRLTALGFGVATAWDLIRAAVAERASPTWERRPDGRDTGTTGREGMMGGWRRDFGYAARALGRAPGFATVTVLTLGLAIGANAGIFSVLFNVVLRPLPYQDPDRLVYIAASAPGSDFPEEFGVSAEFYVQYRDEATLLENISTYNAFTATLRAGDRTERVPMSWPTPSLFETLGATPILGRLPEPEDEDRVVVISYALWTTWFGSDPGVIGRSYEVINEPRTVIGVMGPEFRFPGDRVLLWVPNTQIGTGDIQTGRFGLPLVGRLAPGATTEDLVEQLTTVARRLPERFGGSPSYARLMEQHRPVVRPLREQLLGSVSRPLWVLMGSVVVVLLIACANVANLFTVRVESRQRDLAVRRALGAGRGELVRTQMAEAVLLALAGGALGVLIAWVGTPLLVAAARADVPRADTVAVDLTTVAFVLSVSLLAALACGLAPALGASAPDLQRLRDAGRGSTRRRHWGRNGLVVAQTALALVLLVGSGLLVRSFWRLAHVDPGYDTEDIFTFQIAPEDVEGLDDGPSFARFHMMFMDRIQALPGVESVGIVENLPLDEGVRGGRFVVEDQPDGQEDGYLVRYTWAGGDYFATHGVDVLSGRRFTRADHESEHGNAVINQTAARLFWPGQDPIGRRFQFRDGEDWHTVVGVVEDVRQLSLRDTPDPLIYFPMVGPKPDSWAVVSPAYVVKTRRAEEIAPEVRALVRELAPTAPMYRVYTMHGLRAQSVSRLSFTMLTLALASGLALILGSIGLYGVLSYVVALRTQEIGVRMALGARAGEVRRMVVAQGARVVALGIGIGLVLAAVTTRLLGSLLFATEPLDGVTFVAMAMIMVAVGFLASYLPARRASNLDPIASLRAE